MVRWNERIGTKPLLIGLATVVVVSVGAVAVVQTRSDDDQVKAAPAVVPSSADKVLQAVTVTVGAKGALSAVQGSVVGTTSDSSQFAFTKDYAPGKVADQLPVRVLTSYRTAKTSGTDLSDLQGYTGRVDISLTLQNLTQKAQELNYDVNGGQKTQSALVGVPLTVVASTALPKVAPSAVVTQAGSDGSATNGVLSQDAAGTTQVQWASILAPPQLGSTTTMTLAVNATKFSVPQFDISVQPGLVTDPSVGALLDNAFNPTGSSEMKLQQRTIDLIGQVNTVLARAGKSMDRVRKTLGDSSKTLGTKTVSDLKGSTTGIASSMKELKGSLSSLGQDLSSTLDSTKSTTLSELAQTVQTVDQMLGDTHAKAPAAKVTGVGCDVSVQRVDAGNGLYGNLLEVVSLLDGYSQATTGCKETVQAQLLGSVGPVDPSAATCVDATSVTCSLQALGKGLNGFADQLAASGQSAVASLGSLKTQDLINAVDGVDTVDAGGVPVKQGGLAQQVAAVDTLTGDLGDLTIFGGSGTNVSSLNDALKGVVDQVANVTAVVSGLHQDAVAGASGADKLAATNQSLADKICELAATPALDPAVADTLRNYTSLTSCAAADGTTTPLPGGRNSMEQQIADQADAWQSIADATETGSSTVWGAKLLALTTAITAVQTAINTLGSDSSVSVGDARSAYKELTDAVATLNSAASAVSTKAATVQSQETAVAASISSAFDTAVAGTRSQAALDPLIRQVTADAQVNSNSLAQLFDKSLSGLNSAGTEIAADGAQTVQQQQKKFAQTSKSSSKRVTQGINSGLGQVTKGVTSSTRDLGAAQVLLTKDLQNILLDLGTRKVKGSGLLGAMTTSTATASSANYQLALASNTAAAYANVRQGDINGLLLRQAQYDAGQQALADLPAFGLPVPSGAAHRTVYSFVVTSGS